MKEWYLMGSMAKPHSLGGFENDAFIDYRYDAFDEVLDTEMASIVPLYNHDLTEKKELRCIIESNMADTYEKADERMVLAPIGSMKTGMYIYYHDAYWLINGFVGNNHIYEKAVMVLCQYFLKWQNSMTGEIVGRWCSLMAANKYSVGKNGNANIVLSANNYKIQITMDDETYKLDGKRVFIDSNLKAPVKVYDITRNDDMYYNYTYGGNGGVLEMLADKTEFDPNSDRQDLGICDYFEPRVDASKPSIERASSVVISHKGDAAIISGGSAKEFVATVYSANGRVIPNAVVNWDINLMPGLENLVRYETSGNKIKLWCLYNKSLIGAQLLITASYGDKEKDLYIAIGGGI